MKAFILDGHGGIEHLALTELPIPSINNHEVLIHMKAISVNRVDSFVRQHDFALPVFYKPEPGEQSIVLGWDVSGVVTEVGQDVKTLKPGDEVFGLVNFFGRGRTNAEYVVAPAAHLAKKPANISHEEAAAAGLAALTAFEAIMLHGDVKPGQRVLIHGAAGGVGHYAVQLAKRRGASVAGTGSEMSKSFILESGADEFVNYKQADFPDNIRQADIILDTRSGDHIMQSIALARHGGKVISLLPHQDPTGMVSAAAQTKQLFMHRVVVSSNGARMKIIADFMKKQQLKSSIAKVFPFDQLPLAHREVETNRTKGKIIVVAPGKI